jgi:hypothetical protein
MARSRAVGPGFGLIVLFIFEGCSELLSTSRFSRLFLEKEIAKSFAHLCKGMATWWLCAVLMLGVLGPCGTSGSGAPSEVVDVSDFMRWVDSGDEGTGLKMPVGEIGEEPVKKRAGAANASMGQKQGLVSLSNSVTALCAPCVAHSD